jgi:hypothetical protein
MPLCTDSQPSDHLLKQAEGSESAKREVILSKQLRTLRALPMWRLSGISFAQIPPVSKGKE